MVGMGAAHRLQDSALRDHGEFDLFGLLIRPNRSTASWALANLRRDPPVKVIGRRPGEASCLDLVWAVHDRASRAGAARRWPRPAPRCSTTYATNDSTHRRRYEPPTPPRSPRDLRLLP